MAPVVMVRVVIAWVVAASSRAAVLAGVWLSFTAASPDYAVYGAFSVAVCTVLSLWLLPPRGPVRLRRWPRRAWFSAVLCLWFVWQSVRGGVDVAQRALRHPVRIDPAVVTAPIDLPDGHARQVAMVLMNLMPGSMIQRTTDRFGVTAQVTAHAHTAEPVMVELHTLAAELNPARQWRQLQHRVRRAFD